MNNGRKSKSLARRWLPLLGGLALIALIVAGLWPKPVPVETALASVGELRATVNEEAKTRIKQRYVISAPVAGQLRRIPFKVGAEVKAGEVVAVIEPLSPALLDVRTRATAEAKRDTAAANLEKARASHGFASSEIRRLEQLFSQHTISIQELESAQLRESSAETEQAAAESALRQAQAELTEFSLDDSVTNAPCPPRKLEAPVDARVLHVFEESARSVTTGTPLLELGDPADLEVVIEVLSRDAAAIAPGAKVEFDQWGSTDAPKLLGRVRLIEPAAFTKVSALGVEEQRVKVVADLTTPPEQRTTVGDNYRLEAHIIVWEDPQALQVPEGALFRRGERWATYVEADGRANLRPLQVGHTGGSRTQILDGLRPGEKVILFPGSHVQPGQRVREIHVSD